MKVIERCSRFSFLGKIFFIGCVIFFILWTSISLPKSNRGYVEADFFEYWAGGRALSEGRNPYDATDWKAIRGQLEGTWQANQYSVYPLITNLMFVPLSLLPISTAASVWLALSQIMIAASVFLCFQSASFTRWRIYLIIILVGIILFRPAIISVRNGQLGGFLLLLLSIGIWLWTKGYWYVGGVVVGLLVMKPSVASSFFVIFGIWFLLRKRWRAIFGMLTTSVMSLAVFLLFDIQWVNAWIEAGSGKFELMAPYMPSLWGFTALVFNRTAYWYVIGGIATLLTIALIFWIFRKVQPSEESFVLGAFLIPLAILVMPFLWSYDQIYLLIPLIFIIALLDRLRIPFIIIGSVFLVFDLLALLLLLFAFQVGHDIWSILLPISILLVSSIAWRLARKDRNSESPRGLTGKAL